MSGPLETDFESTICSWLVDHGGYVGPVKVGNAQGDPRDFDAVRGLDTAELFAFIGATQADVWEQLVTRYGGDRDAAQAKFATGWRRSLMIGARSMFCVTGCRIMG